MMGLTFINYSLICSQNIYKTTLNVNPVFSMATKTIEQFMAELEARGETLVEWSKRHDFPLHAVYQMTSGITKGRRGQAHQIAVAMGIKADPSAANQQAA